MNIFNHLPLFQNISDLSIEDIVDSALRQNQESIYIAEGGSIMNPINDDSYKQLAANKIKAIKNHKVIKEGFDNAKFPLSESAFHLKSQALAEDLLKALRSIPKDAVLQTVMIVWNYNSPLRLVCLHIPDESFLADAKVGTSPYGYMIPGDFVYLVDLKMTYADFFGLLDELSQPEEIDELMDMDEFESLAIAYSFQFNALYLSALISIEEYLRPNTHYFVEEYDVDFFLVKKMSLPD
jgi:hypothetical protein